MHVCTVRGCNIQKRQKESVPIRRFPKRGDAEQRWIETFANSYLSRLEHLQIVKRQYFVGHQHFDEQYYYQKRNGAFLLKCDFLNFGIKSNLSTSIFIFSTISQILLTKFYVLLPQTYRNLKSIKFTNFLSITCF